MYLEWELEKIRVPQRAFLERIDKDIAASVKKPERVVEQAFLDYKEFFSKQKNLTGITFRNILERHFPMDLPPAKKARAEIRKSIREDLLPEKFPVSMSKFRSEKQKEAEKLFPLAKIGDKVKVRSARHGNYIGIFNGLGNKGSSVRIDRKVFSMYDLERESRALFDPTLNEPVKEEYVIRECDSYRAKIDRFTDSVLAKEMRKRGYFRRVDFFSPAEYLAFMESKKTFKTPKNLAKQRFKRAKEAELKKFYSSDPAYLSSPTYYTTGPKSNAVKTIREIGGGIRTQSRNK